MATIKDQDRGGDKELRKVHKNKSRLRRGAGTQEQKEHRNMQIYVAELSDTDANEDALKTETVRCSPA